jgi:alkylated DNA repair dioxygenase AlkB
VPHHAWLNLYRDQQDSTGWHGDWPSCRRASCVVPVLSLGATRRFLLKPRTGGRSVILTPRGGDLVVMGGRCQQDWRHCVPKQTTPAGIRISVNFQSCHQAGARDRDLVAFVDPPVFGSAVCLVWAKRRWLG